jgi:CheY-like chemotaxis protein
MKKHILLIDDDEDELEIFCDALNKLDGPFSCSQVKACDEALHLLKTFLPDYIFIDLNMPIVNGLQCISRIAEMNGGIVTTMILYSTSIDDKTKHAAISLGVKSCLIKPRETGQLAKKLKKILSPVAD